LLIIVLIVL